MLRQNVSAKTFAATLKVTAGTLNTLAMKRKIVSANGTLGVFLVGRHGCWLEIANTLSKVLASFTYVTSEKYSSIF